MPKIDIQDLKAHFEEYVDRSRSGEPVIVTVGGEPVAEIVALSAERRELLRLAETGELSWNGGKPKGLRGVVVRGEPVSDTVIRNRR
jgi:prevent-host-death family protein